MLNNGFLLFSLLGAAVGSQGSLDVENVNASQTCVADMLAMYEADSDALNNAYHRFTYAFVDTCESQPVCTSYAMSNMNGDGCIGAAFDFVANVSAISNEPTLLNYTTACDHAGGKMVEETLELRAVNVAVKTTTVYSVTIIDMPLCIASSCDANDQQELLKSQFYELLPHGENSTLSIFIEPSATDLCFNSETTATGNSTCTITVSKDKPADDTHSKGDGEAFQNANASKTCIDDMTNIYSANSSALSNANSILIGSLEECMPTDNTTIVCDSYAMSTLDWSGHDNAMHVFDANFSSFLGDTPFLSYDSACGDSGGQMMLDAVQLHAVVYTVNATTEYTITFVDIPLCVATSCSSGDQLALFESQFYELLTSDSMSSYIDVSFVARCREGNADATDNSTCTVSFASLPSPPQKARTTGATAANLQAEMSASNIPRPLASTSAAVVAASFLYAFYTSA